MYPVDEVYLEDISEVMPGLGPGSREYEWIQRQLQQFRRADQSGEGLCGMPAMLPEFVLKVGARAIIEAAAYEPGKGVLAFLSGIGEIEALAEQVPKTAKTRGRLSSYQVSFSRVSTIATIQSPLENDFAATIQSNKMTSQSLRALLLQTDI